MKKRIALLILILVALVTICAAAEENGKMRADNKTIVYSENLKLYSIDSLQAGCYPIQGEEFTLLLSKKDDNTVLEEYQNNLQVECLSGNSAEAKEYLSNEGNGIHVNFMKMKQPGQSTWYIRAESKSLYAEETVTLNVINQQDDPDWVMPKSSLVWFATPGEDISIWKLIPQVTDMKAQYARFFAEQEVSYAEDNFQ